MTCDLHPLPEPKPKDEAPLTGERDPWATIGATISRTSSDKPLSERIRRTAYQVYLENIDPAAPLRQLTRAAIDGEPLADANNPEFLHRLAENSFTKALSAMKYGPVDLAGKKLGPGMEEIFDRFKPGEDSERFEQYAKARWSENRAAQGKETGVDPEAAKIVIREGAARYEKAFKDLVAFQNHTLTPLVRTGILSEGGHAAMVEENEAYMPAVREGAQARPVPGAGAQGTTTRNPLKPMKGSELPTRPIVESIIGNTIRRYQLADQAAANNAARDAAEPLGLAAPSSKSKPAQSALSDIDKWEANDSNDAALANLAGHHLKADEIPTFQNGVMTPYVFIDENMPRTLRGYNTATLSTWARLISGATKLQRNLIVLNPLFPVHIFAYDVPFQAVTNPENRNVLASVYTGLKTMFKDPEAHTAWFNSGGADHVFDVASRDQYIKQVMKGEADPAFNDRVWNAIKSPYQALQTWARVVNQVIPLGRYVRGKEMGEPDERAAFASQDAKFHRPGAGGPYSKALNALQPFYTAYVNGLEKTWKAGTGFDLAGNRVMSGQRVLGNHAMAAALITLPMLANWWENKDEDWYKAEHSWKKDNGLYVGVGGGVHMYIKLPPIISFVYGALPKMLMEKYYADNPHAFDHTWEDAVGTFAPPGGLISYNLALPAVEHLANYSIFRSAPIVTDEEKKYLPELRYNAYTTETAKELGRIIGMPPAVVDNYINDWLPGMGVAGIRLGEKLMAVKANPPDWHIEDWPLISSWMARHGPSASAEPILDFRGRMKKVEEVHESAVKYMREDDFAGFSALLKQYPREAAALKYSLRGEPAMELPADTSRYEDAMNKVADAEPDETQDVLAASQELKVWEQKARYVGSISNPKELPPSEKQQLLDQIYSKMQEVSERGQKAADKAGFK